MPIGETGRSPQGPICIRIAGAQTPREHFSISDSLSYNLYLLKALQIISILHMLFYSHYHVEIYATLDIPLKILHLANTIPDLVGSSKQNHRFPST